MMDSTVNVRAGLNGKMVGLRLRRLLVMSSRYPNTDEMLTRRRRVKKRPAHNHPVLMLARDVSISVMAASHNPCPVIDMRAGSDARLVRLMILVLLATPGR
jgi:hypothetical protein